MQECLFTPFQWEISQSATDLIIEIFFLFLVLKLIVTHQRFRVVINSSLNRHSWEDDVR